MTEFLETVCITHPYVMIYLKSKHKMEIVACIFFTEVFSSDSEAQ